MSDYFPTYVRIFIIQISCFLFLHNIFVLMKGYNYSEFTLS